MTRTGKIAIATTIALSLVAGSAAYAKHRFGDSDKRRAHMVNYVADELDLNDTQKTSLDSLVDQVVSMRKQMHGEFKQDLSGLTTMITDEQFDQSRALDLVNAKADTMKQNAPNVVAALGNFLDGLNAEQKAEIVEFIEHKREHRRRGWH